MKRCGYTRGWWCAAFLWAWVLLGTTTSSAFVFAPAVDNSRSRPCSAEFRSKRMATTQRSCIAGRLSQLYLRPSSQENEENKASNLIRRFFMSLSRGILFSKPISPSITQALFGIQGKRRNEKQSPVSPSVSFSLRECFVCISLYLLLGIGAYSYLMEHWSFIDSVYFSVTSFTTVGYGDLVPHTSVSKLFTCLFALGGIAFLGAALASIGSSLVQAELNAVKAAQRASRINVMNVIESFLRGKKRGKRGTNSTITAVVPFNATAVKTGDMMPLPQKAVWATVRSVVVKLVPSFILLMLGGMAMGRLEGWSWLDSIYYAFITAGTVGLGDLSPRSQRARFWAIFFVPLAVAAGGDILGSVASALLERRRTQVYRDLMSRDFTIEHIKEMDRDGDGEVARHEYMEFMLLEMKLVEPSVIQELNDQFDRLDMTMSDSLTKDDLILMAKLRRSREEQVTDVNGDF